MLLSPVTSSLKPMAIPVITAYHFHVYLHPLSFSEVSTPNISQTIYDFLSDLILDVSHTFPYQSHLYPIYVEFSC